MIVFLMKDLKISFLLILQTLFSFFFIRTLWYNDSLALSNLKKPFSFIENEGFYRTALAKSDRYH
jgi:hypothetical protein